MIAKSFLPPLVNKSTVEKDRGIIFPHVTLDLKGLSGYVGTYQNCPEK